MVQVARASNSCLASCGLTSVPGSPREDPLTTLVRDARMDPPSQLPSGRAGVSSRMQTNVSTCSQFAQKSGGGNMIWAIFLAISGFKGLVRGGGWCLLSLKTSQHTLGGKEVGLTW